MTISFLSYSTASNGGGGTTSVPVPSGISNGDYMVIFMSSGNSNGVTPPAGWTQIVNYNTNSLRFFAYGKTANDEPAAYTWTHTALLTFVCGAWTTGGGVLSPNTLGTVQNVASGSSFTFNSINPTMSGVLIICGAFDTSNGVAGSWQAPTDMVKRVDFKGIARPCLALMDMTNSNAGPTGDKIGSWTGIAANATGVMIALDDSFGAPVFVSDDLFFGQLA